TVRSALRAVRRLDVHDSPTLRCRDRAVVADTRVGATASGSRGRRDIPSGIRARPAEPTPATHATGGHVALPGDQRQPSPLQHPLSELDGRQLATGSDDRRRAVPVDRVRIADLGNLNRGQIYRLVPAT